MAWLWSDTLAALLVEHDRVRPERVVGMTERPIGYRLGADEDPLELARAVLRRLDVTGNRKVSTRSSQQ